MRLLWFALALIGFMLLFIMLSGALPDLESDKLARFIYLAFFLLLIGLAIFGERLPLGKWLHYTLIWCVLIVALFMGYHYRYQLQDFTSQVTSGLIPSSPLMRTQENSTSVTLRRALNGHFEVQALVNHQAHITFMLDTGASSVVLSHEDARRLGFDMVGLRFSVPTYTANGETRTALVRLRSLKIGEIERHNLRALVAQPQVLPDSLLGMNFLNSLSGYDVRADQLTLID